MRPAAGGRVWCWPWGLFSTIYGCVVPQEWDEPELPRSQSMKCLSAIHWQTNEQAHSGIIHPHSCPRFFASQFPSLFIGHYSYYQKYTPLPSSSASIVATLSQPPHFCTTHDSTPLYLQGPGFRHTASILLAILVLPFYLGTVDTSHGADCKSPETTTSGSHLRCLPGLQESKVQMQRRPATVLTVC